MNKKFEISVQDLFDTYNAMCKAEVAGNHKEAHAKVRDGLLESCEILRFMVSDSLLNSAHPEPQAWRLFQRVLEEGKLDDFLNIERKVLQQFTDLRADFVEVIVSALRQAIQVMIQREGCLDASWVLLLNQLATSVCGKVEDPGSNTSWWRYLKRGALAGAGGVVVVVNLIGASNPQLGALEFLKHSVDVGTWLIAWAATGVLDNWAEPKTSQ